MDFLETPVQKAIKDWTPEQLDEFEERAAIIEHDAYTTRENAEVLAYTQIMKARKIDRRNRSNPA